MNRLYRTDGWNTRGTEKRLIKDSEVIKVGDWIIDEATGAANVDAVTEKVFGLATAIVTAKGISLENNLVDTGALGGTWASSTKQYTAAADNSTVDGVMVEFTPVREGDEFIATIDDAKGTTTGSNKKGYRLAILTSDSSKLDESSAATADASTQFMITDPYDDGPTTEVIVKVTARGTDQFAVAT